MDLMTDTISHSFTQGLLERDRASFQQFTLANADVTAKACLCLTQLRSQAYTCVDSSQRVLRTSRNHPRWYRNCSFRFVQPASRVRQCWIVSTLGRRWAWQVRWEASRHLRRLYFCRPIRCVSTGPVFMYQTVLIVSLSNISSCLAIQLGKLAGFSPIIATASPHNTTFLVSLGATHVLDRRLSSEAIREEVSKITPLPIETIFDGASLPDTQDAAYDLLAPGGCLVLVLFEKIDEAKKTKDKRVEKAWGQVNAPENRAVGAGLYKKLPALLEEGAIRVCDAAIVFE